MLILQAVIAENTIKVVDYKIVKLKEEIIFEIVRFWFF